MATNENNLSEETLATLEIIKNYVKSKDDWWLERRIDILEVQIGIEKNNAKIEVYKSLQNGTN
jgi:hypothetical protein|tara:strand:- start:93 stop:281 length:189 start_codon:yes stop_codon:yes gene_type:complete